MKKRENGAGTIFRWRDRFKGEYTDQNHKRHCVYGKTQAECRSKLAEALESVRKDTFVEPDKITTSQWIDYWFENYYCISSKPSSQATTHQGIRTHIKPRLGNIRLQKLSTDNVQTMIRSMQKDGLSPATIRRHFKTLRQALQQAVNLQKIFRNPTDSVVLPDNTKPDIKFLNQAEQQAVLMNLPDNTHGRAIRFLLGTGMRVSEMCGLKWNDIKEDGIHVERTNMTIKDWREDGYINVETLPKTSAGKRVIPIGNALKSLLNEQRSAQYEEILHAGTAWAGNKANGYVFANALGKPNDKHNISRTFRRICDLSGIERRGIHALRHTFATNWVQNSPDIPALSRILGHADTAFTYKTYCHADSSSMEKGMNMMEQFIKQA